MPCRSCPRQLLRYERDAGECEPCKAKRRGAPTLAYMERRPLIVKILLNNMRLGSIRYNAAGERLNGSESHQSLLVP